MEYLFLLAFAGILGTYLDTVAGYAAGAAAGEPPREASHRRCIEWLVFVIVTAVGVPRCFVRSL